MILHAHGPRHGAACWWMSANAIWMGPYETEELAKEDAETSPTKELGQQVYNRLWARELANGEHKPEDE